MLDLTSLLIFAGALAVVAGTPGPSIAALTARVVTGGIGSVMPFLAAMWIGEAIWLAGAVFGLSALASEFGALFLVLKWLGIAYLLFLAVKMWRQKPLPPGELPKAGGWKMFAAGMGITMGNPKAMAFYVVVLPASVDLTQVGMIGWAELTATMLAVLMAVDLSWAFAAERARRLLRSPRALRIANRVSATAMGGAAVAMATK